MRIQHQNCDKNGAPAGVASESNHRLQIVLRKLFALLRTVVLAGLVSPVMIGTGAIGVARAETVHLNIIGSLGGINLYTKQEEPFWRTEIEKISKGRVRATVHPFDRSGLPGPEMLQLIQMGVVPFGTALLSLLTGDEPQMSAVDLPALNPDIATLRKTVAAFRPYMSRQLRERYNIELLGVYTYPAQVVFCAKPFRDLNDLAGRRVRTSSVGQSEVMLALGAIPVKIPFAETVDAITKGVVDCAITGTLSGNEIGLSKVTTHVHAMAINWGVSIFAANAEVWSALPGDVRDILRQSIGDLEVRIWTAAERETSNGLNCNIGAASCIDGQPGRMTLVAITPEDEATRRRLLIETALPRWIERCGDECAKAWNSSIGLSFGLFVQKDRTVSGLMPATESPSQ